MTTSMLRAGVAALLLALVHVITPSLKFLNGTPRSAWLSMAGGVSVAYVFVHLLPELAKGQEQITKWSLRTTPSPNGMSARRLLWS